MMDMSGPGWLADFFAAVMLAVAIYCAGRLIAARIGGRPTSVETDVTHVLMGVAMAGMLVADLNFLNNHVWEAVFIVMSAWYAWRTYHLVAGRQTGGTAGHHDHGASHYPTHLIMALAMIYMYLAPVSGASGSGGNMAMGGPSGTAADFVGLPLLFLLALLLSGTWELDRLGRFQPAVAVAIRRRPTLAVVGVDGRGAHPAGGEQAEPVGPAPESGPSGGELAPRLEGCCHLAMCVTMAYMLILML